MTHPGLLPAAALGGHLVHVIVFGGALALGAVVYGVATITQPRPGAQRATTSPGSVAIAQQVAFLGLCAAAGMHLAVMPDHFRESWIYGAFFAIAAPVQIALACLVLSRARRAELSAALAFSLAVVVLWAITRFVGVPIGPNHGATEQLGVLDIFATVAELVTAGALIYALRSQQFRASGRVACAWRWALWSPLTRTLLAATAIAVPLLSAVASRS